METSTTNGMHTLQITFSLFCYLYYITTSLVTYTTIIFECAVLNAFDSTIIPHALFVTKPNFTCPHCAECMYPSTIHSLSISTACIVTQRTCLSMKAESLEIQVHFLSKVESCLVHTDSSHTAMLQDSQVHSPHHSNTYGLHIHTEHNRHKDSLLLQYHQSIHNSTTPLACEMRIVAALIHS